MNQINFIQAPSPKEQQALHRWFWRSIVVITLLLIGLATYSIHQLNLFRSLQSEHTQLAKSTKQLDQCLTEKRKLKDQEGRLKQQLTKTTRIKQKPKNPATLLQLFISTLPQNVSLHTFNLKKKQLDITLLGNSSHNILSYLEQLRKSSLLAQIDMQTLEPSNGYVKTTIQAKTS